MNDAGARKPLIASPPRPSAAGGGAASLGIAVPPAVPEPPPRPQRRLKLGHVLFLCLLLSGSIPLLIGNSVLIRQNRAILLDLEQQYLARSADSVSLQVGNSLVARRRELAQVGKSLLAGLGEGELGDRLREPWVRSLIAGFLDSNPDLEVVAALDLAGQGPRLGRREQPESVRQDLTSAFEEARRRQGPVYRLSSSPAGEEPLVVLAMPVSGTEGAPGLMLESVGRLDLLAPIFGSTKDSNVSVLLTGADGTVLWSTAHAQELQAALAREGLLSGMGKSPISFTRSFRARLDGEERDVQMTVSRLAETQWQLAVLKPTTAAFAAVQRMVFNTLLSSLLLILLALVFAVWVARWVGEPFHRLTATTKQIADGKLGHRVELGGLTFEMSDLAQSFNRMSGQLETYVDRLRDAAAANRELFIGSIRAFAAAIDAKDPYTRGHSERVAAISRAVARHMGFDEDFQQRIWLGALLHDVGKIGIDDRVLKKGSLLTAEEYDQMKLHTVIGAEIMGRIDQLREIVPAIRWHHEAWNGKGYPDQLRGEQIPLIARIVSVADTYDAVTTSRPYQQAYTPEFAVSTITRLAGARFDAKVVTAFLSAFESGQIESAIQRPPAPTEEVKASAALMG